MSIDAVLLAAIDPARRSRRTNRVVNVRVPDLGIALHPEDAWAVRMAMLIFGLGIDLSALRQLPLRADVIVDHWPELRALGHRVTREVGYADDGTGLEWAANAVEYGCGTLEVQDAYGMVRELDLKLLMRVA